MKCHLSTCGRKINVTVVSLLLPRRHTQEPARVQLGEGADQQGPVGLLVMSEDSLESALKEGNLGADLWRHQVPWLGSELGPSISASTPPPLLLCT